MALALVATIVCTILCVVLHLYVLRLLWHYVWPRVQSKSGPGIAGMVIGCIIGHMIEIGIFAVGMYFIAVQENDAKLEVAAMEYKSLQIWYYSANFYTSLGAEAPPTAGLRVFTACEALVGLILITWTASFLFLLMQRSWGHEPSTRK